MDIAALIHSYGYAVVAIGAFLEGETVLLLAGAAVVQGHLALPAVVAVATLASFLGDQLYFLAGRRHGTALLGRFPALQPRVERVMRLLERWHLPLILGIRFLYGLRIAGVMALGMSSVAWPRFSALNFIGAAAWASLIAAVGYGAGHALMHALAVIDADELWGLALLLAAGALWWLAARRRRAAHAQALARPSHAANGCPIPDATQARGSRRAARADATSTAAEAGCPPPAARRPESIEPTPRR
ncbi:MAG TPA: DedA family protein [Rubrivivax sp.]|nr:DedA family protein [Rubrivivax sp.]